MSDQYRGWHQLHQWACDRNIPLPNNAAPPAFAVAVFLLERLHGTWRPPGAKNHRPIRLKTAESLAYGITGYCRHRNWPESHLKGAGPVQSVLCAAKTHLPAEQVQRHRSRALTNQPTPNNQRGDFGVLINAVTIAAESPHTSPLWVARQQALLTTQFFSGLRIGAVLLLERNAIKWTQGTNGTPVCVITDWHPKGRSPDGTQKTTVWCCCDTDTDLCAVHALDRWLALLDDHAPGITRVFPTVYRLNPFHPVPLPQTYRPTGPLLSNIDLSRVPWTVCITHTTTDPVSTPTTSQEEACFVCTTCGVHTVSIVRCWLACKFPCPPCRNLYIAARRGNLIPTNADEQPQAVVDELDGHRQGHRPPKKLLNRLEGLENQWLQWLAKEANVAPETGESISTHGFRRGHATTLAAIGATDLQIAAALHHQSPATAIQYIEEKNLITNHPLTPIPGFEHPESSDAIERATLHLSNYRQRPSVQAD